MFCFCSLACYWHPDVYLNSWSRSVTSKSCKWHDSSKEIWKDSWTAADVNFKHDKVFDWQKSGTEAEFSKVSYLCTSLSLCSSVSWYLLSFYYRALQLYCHVQCYSFLFPQFHLVFCPFRIFSLSFIGEIRIERYDTVILYL